MICPKGAPVYENLSSEYTDVPQLLSTLRAETFSGIVAIQAIGRKGTFFISAGETIDAILGTEADPTATVGEEAVEELFVLCTNPTTTLGVYELSAKEVEFAVTTLQSEMVFKGLSTDFVRLDRFLKKLASERHNGYIEVFTKDNQSFGIISLRDGKADQLFTLREPGISSLSPTDGIPAFLQEIATQGMLFNVYRTAAPSAPVNGADQWAGQGPMVTEEDEPETRTEGGNGHQYTPDVRREETERDGLAERTQFVVDLQTVLFKIEKFINGVAENGGFQRAFKRACVEKSESYPFLDPFEGQFDYSGGRIHLDEQVSIGVFAVAIAECLNLTLTYLHIELPKKTVLPANLRGDIESSFRGYRDVLTGSGLQSVIPSTFQ
jgi:hypothetical protein